MRGVGVVCVGVKGSAPGERCVGVWSVGVVLCGCMVGSATGEVARTCGVGGSRKQVAVCRFGSDDVVGGGGE